VFSIAQKKISQKISKYRIKPLSLRPIKIVLTMKTRFNAYYYGFYFAYFNDGVRQ
jgi:hypothetical protein